MVEPGLHYSGLVVKREFELANENTPGLQNFGPLKYFDWEGKQVRDEAEAIEKLEKSIEKRKNSEESKNENWEKYVADVKEKKHKLEDKALVSNFSSLKVQFEPILVHL